MKKRNNYGFTLIELIIVSAVLAITSLAIYSVFNSGIKIWQKVNSQLPEEDIDIFLDRFSYDLRNSFKFTDIHFLGEKDRLEFSTLVDSPRLENRTVGQVAYFYDPMSEIIKREERDFSHLFRDKRGAVTHSLSYVTSLKFMYYIYDSESEEYFWLDEWSKKGLPLAIRVKLEVIDGTQTNKYVKTVDIPVSI